jgi:hypothetical protein
MKAKASELRIGNLVEYPNWNNDGSKAYFKIRDIYFDDGRIGLTNGSIIIPATKLAYLKPIPLTEEWLLKFGFSREEKIGGDGIEFRVYHFDVLTFNTNHLWWYKCQPMNDTPLEYVHQLQNFYFALTGKELTLNP